MQAVSEQGVQCYEEVAGESMPGAQSGKGPDRKSSNSEFPFRERNGGLIGGLDFRRVAVPEAVLGVLNRPNKR
jgi:hypothetical protein